MKQHLPNKMQEYLHPIDRLSSRPTVFTIFAGVKQSVVKGNFLKIALFKNEDSLLKKKSMKSSKHSITVKSRIKQKFAKNLSIKIAPLNTICTSLPKSRFFFNRHFQLFSRGDDLGKFYYIQVSKHIFVNGS